MYINKDIFVIIESYSQYHNIYNFINNDQVLNINCDQCKCTFNSCSNRNKIIYKLKEFDNSIMKFLNLNFVDLSELNIINKMTYLDIEYEKINYIFCNNCILKIENIEKNHKIDVFGITDFMYISYKYMDVIKHNNFYFHNDLIESYNIIIDRRQYSYNDINLYMKLIKFNNYNYNEMENLRPDNLKKIKKILIENFKINLNYINKCIETKYV